VRKDRVDRAQRLCTDDAVATAAPFDSSSMQVTSRASAVSSTIRMRTPSEPGRARLPRARDSGAGARTADPRLRKPHDERRSAARAPGSRLRRFRRAARRGCRTIARPRPRPPSARVDEDSA
jgi:hypothetical protein